jgi:Mg2+/Co2+ transporter CorB
MLLPGILLFVLCLVLSAFFSSSETAFSSIATSVVISRVLGLTFEIDPEESAVKEDERS